MQTKSRWQEEKEEREYLKIERYCLQNENLIEPSIKDIDNIFCKIN